MNKCVSQVLVLLVMLGCVLPGATMAQKSPWNDVPDKTWDALQQGAKTDLADGQYKTPAGKFLVVSKSKVVVRGWDYRKYQPTAGTAASQSPPRATPSTKSVQAAPQEGIEPDEIDARATSRDAASGLATGKRQSVQAAPQEGIEPDEIDARATSRDAASGLATGKRQSMLVQLGPAQAARLPEASQTSSGSSAKGIQAKPAEPPKYEVADCGTNVSPMICCHHESGDGSSCNLFKILCENAGGTAQGDGESAACSNWD
jgi:hypothetical protein